MMMLKYTAQEDIMSDIATTVDTPADFPVLYVFVRTSLNSMNSGKAQAHSGHAANAFMYEHAVNPLATCKPVDKVVQQWMGSTRHGFGTQINLLAPWDEVVDLVARTQSMGLAAGVIEDPTYPYEVDSEIVPLIWVNWHTMPPIDKGNGKSICFRPECTAAYVFGMKSELQDQLGHYPLHP